MSEIQNQQNQQIDSWTEPENSFDPSLLLEETFSEFIGMQWFEKQCMAAVLNGKVNTDRERNLVVEVLNNDLPLYNKPIAETTEPPLVSVWKRLEGVAFELSRWSVIHAMAEDRNNLLEDAYVSYAINLLSLAGYSSLQPDALEHDLDMYSLHDKKAPLPFNAYTSFIKPYEQVLVLKYNWLISEGQQWEDVVRISREVYAETTAIKDALSHLWNVYSPFSRGENMVNAIVRSAIAVEEPEKTIEFFNNLPFVLSDNHDGYLFRNK